MGAYGSKPITDKVSSDETGKYVKCGASSMQGWRVSQEDAHNCILEYDENKSLFAVYDGHGGHEVAQYCSENMPQYLKECASYKNGEYSKALKEAFLGFDATLIEPKVVKVLKQIVISPDEAESENQQSASEDEENIRNLYEEAQMPLEEVMLKYQADGNPTLKKIIPPSTPPSPYLVAKQSSKLKVSDEACSSKAGGSSSRVEFVEESSSESAEKDGNSSNGEAETSTKNESCENEQVSEKDSKENGGRVETGTQETNGGKLMQNKQDSIKDGGSGRNQDLSSSSNTPLRRKGDNVVNISKDLEMEKEEKGKFNEGKDLKEELKDEKQLAGNRTKENEVIEKVVKTEEIKNEKESNTSVKKLEVNGDVDSKDIEKESEGEPHENGDVAEEDTEDDDEKVSNISKGKGKAIAKVSNQPQRTSARQRNMAVLFRSLLSAQDGNDSESDEDDDEDGDEPYQGGEERSSSEDEDQEAEKGEEEEEDEEEDEEEEDDGEEEEEEDYGGISKLAKGPGVESGCTAVVALLHGRDLYVANAGDSRCIVSRSGEALDMSLDHKPEDDIEIERIVAAGGFVSSDGRVNGGLNLSRAIGDHAYKQTENLPPEEQMITALPDVRTLSLDTEKDEFMVLACDGIWNSMTSQEVVNFVRLRIQNGDKKLSTICEELFDFCLAPNTASDGTGCDNMTAVIVQFLPMLAEASSSDLPNTSISTTTNKRPASPTESSDSSAKRIKTGVV